MSLLETIFSTLYRNLIDNGGKVNPEIIPKILSKMTRLKPSHFGISKSNLNLPYIQSRNSIGYQHVFGDESSPFTMAVFVLPKSCHMPLHDHPDMTVMSKLLFGKIRILSYDWVPSTKKYDHDGLLVGTGELKEDVIQSAPNSWALFPDKKNLHSIEALEDTALFDIITPPYHPDEGRNCSFFTDDVLKVSSKKKTLGQHVWLQQCYPNYYTISYPYQGPTLSYSEDKEKKNSTSTRTGINSTELEKKQDNSHKNQLNWKLLVEQSSHTSQAVIHLLKEYTDFAKLAQECSKSITSRDISDAKKLKEGINIAMKKGLLPDNPPTSPISKIDTHRKTPEQVVQNIIDHLQFKRDEGCVITIQGLSGTGKGTTAKILSKKIPNGITWSNGNIIRSLTLLAIRCLDLNGVPLTLSELTPAFLQTCMSMMHFGKYKGKYDVYIRGAEQDFLVSEIENTLLKESKISDLVPTIAQMSQGEIIKFTQDNIHTLVKNGACVVVEGRSETLQYLKTPHRFELIFSDSAKIGARRAAQQLIAATLQLLQERSGPITEDVIVTTLKDMLVTMINKET